MGHIFKGISDLDQQHSETVPLLTICEKDIRSIARMQMSQHSLIGVFLYQLRYEIFVRLIKKANFRLRNNAKVVQIYSSMSIKEFEGINARQQWANWRTIPRNLSGNVPNQALSVIDLCCGTGQSTEVLARYLPKGSIICGIEYSADFVRKARNRCYLDATNSKVSVNFRVQSVLETFHDENGNQVRSNTIDLVNCSGAVGSHFNSATTTQLVQEIVRVLVPRGIAMIDSGSKGTSSRELNRICSQVGLRRIRSSRSCVFDLNPQLVFQKEE